MEKRIQKPKIVIVSGYHPKEVFAVEVGELFFCRLKDPEIKVVRYTGRLDKTSTRNLRRFIEQFGSSVLPIVLHSDGNQETDAVIVYCAKSREEKEKILMPLFDFVRRYNTEKTLVVFDIVLCRNAKHSLVEIELNPVIELESGVELVKDFVFCFSKL